MIPGQKEELNFWKEFVKTDRFLSGWVADCKTPELRDYVAMFILCHNHDKVLDVGSGVVSILNGIIHQDHLTAVDPLGGEYQSIFDYEKYHCYPPVAYSAEEMPFENEYDIVHMSNAIDHTQNPIKTYKRLLDAVKPGGYLIIQGFENEAHHEHYRGFHQWDFYTEGQVLCCNDKYGEQTIFDKADIPVQQYVTEQGRDWYIWIKQK